LILAGFLGSAAFADEAPEAGHGVWVEVDIGIVGPASEDILDAAMRQAVDSDAQGLIIRLDTPGGALENTRKMVQSIMAAPFPVVVWVGPAGARAGSAGAFLTMAAHVAAMAPGTNIGASHPVGGHGEDVEGEMERKVLNDTEAFIVSIAKKRGRNIDMARSFVVTSVSITDDEALENNVIDLVARDVPSLLEKLDGRVVELDSGKRLKLAADAGTMKYELTLKQKLLDIVSNPNLFYLFFMAGLIGLGYELTHPGVFLPGVVGAICMILALIATSVLPVSWGAAALILAGVGMLVAEAFVPSFGALGVGGLVAFVVGSIFLVDPGNEQGLRLSWQVIAPGAALIAGAFLALGYIVLRSTRAPVRSGREAMAGMTAKVVTAFEAGEGQVRASGAIWQARLALPSEEQPKVGDTLVIEAVKELDLIVRRPS
jgi:membrane-bound serine protease (ClpP class)